MTNTKEQVLELAKKHGAIIEEKHVGSPVAVYFDELPKLLAFAAAIEEKMKSEGWRQCAKGQGESQFCAQAEAMGAQIAMLRDAAKLLLLDSEECEFDDIIQRVANIGLFEQLEDAAFATQQTAAAFLAERDARVLEEAADKLDEALAGGKIYKPNELRHMAAEKLKQAGQEVEENGNG